MRRAGFSVVALWLAALPASPARAAEPLIADLTSHYIALTTGFSGTEVVMFGAVENGGDVVIVVRGPPRDEVVRRKSRVAGIWVNTQQVAFAAVPRFYAVYSSRPLSVVAPEPVQALHQMGLDHLRLAVIGPPPPAAERAEFSAALLRERERQGLFRRAPGRVLFLGDRLFRATIAFPAALPVGEYRVDAYLLRDGRVIGGQSTPLTVSEAGIAAEVHDFAERRRLLYGLIAVVGAAMAGWLASLPFRNA